MDTVHTTHRDLHSCEDRSVRRRTNNEVFAYSCAQSKEREQKAKVSKGTKPRDSRRMPRFECRGWLHITVSAMSNVMEILLRHEEDHIAYLEQDLPEQWKAYIEEHALKQTPGEVCCA